MSPSVPLKELKRLVKDFVSKIPKAKDGKKKMMEWADQTGLTRGNSALVKISDKAAKNTDIMRPVVNLLPDDSKQAPPVKQKKGKVVSEGDIGTKKVSKNDVVKTKFLSDPARAGKTAIRIGHNLREHLEEGRIVDELEKKGRPIAGRGLAELRQLPRHISDEVKHLTLKHGVSSQTEAHPYNAPQHHKSTMAVIAKPVMASVETSAKPETKETSTQGVSSFAKYHEFLKEVKGLGHSKATIAEMWKAKKLATAEPKPKKAKKAKKAKDD
jgi:hypothetical protein